MLISLIRTVVLYLILIVVIRFMGKRQIGEMEPSEFVVAMLIADLASIPMQDNAISLFSGLVPILAVLALELILAVASMKIIAVRRLLCGKPVILIENGKMIQENLRRTRINLDELAGQLREQGILDLSSVKYAILETNGQISTFLYAKYQPAKAMDAGFSPKDEDLPYTIISDGRLLKKNLALSGKDRAWLNRLLCEQSCRLREVFLLTVDSRGTVYFCKQENTSKS